MRARCNWLPGFSDRCDLQTTAERSTNRSSDGRLRKLGQPQASKASKGVVVRLSGPARHVGIVTIGARQLDRCDQRVDVPVDTAMIAVNLDDVRDCDE